jgi:hypothetical protein
MSPEPGGKFAPAIGKIGGSNGGHPGESLPMKKQSKKHSHLPTKKK